MGICASCDAAAVSPAMTAKLVLADGELREFPRAVRVSLAVDKDPSWFVCDADAMEFDGSVTAMDTDDELRPGQIYFVLPRSMLRRSLHAEEIAALAVKASAALARAAPAYRCRRRSVAPLVFADGDGGAAAPEARGRRSGGKGRNFTSHLCAIPE